MSKQMSREEAVAIIRNCIDNQTHSYDVNGDESEELTEKLKEKCYHALSILAPEPRTEPSIDDFVREVERRAENNMMKTGKLEGAHYAAMKQYQAELSALPMPKGTP